MKQVPGNHESLISLYRKRAADYDASGIRGLVPWREAAVQMLALQPGDRVVDIGCGTGLNFGLLRDAVGPQGTIIGVDLTDAMLDQARRRVAEHGWQNVELVQADAAQFAFPAPVDGILAAFALTFMLDAGEVILNGCRALAPGRAWVVLDTAWPDALPLWFRHGLCFLPSWGITAEVVKRRPWRTVWQTMQQHLGDVERRSFWMGFFYLACGRWTRRDH